MADSSHLYEADKIRIANEAKVRTALEQPDFAQREFQKWRSGMDRQLQRETLATAWAKKLWLAEGRMLMMGRELDKLGHRIARQRKANREQNQRVKDLSAENEQLKRQEAIIELKSPDWPQMIGRLAFDNEKLRQRIAELEKE